MARLEEYRRKRKFDRTPEPAGKEAAAAGSTFVVQKHAARRLHYDFRLAVDGVLKSWAVPKGPSLNPLDKRLAVQTEDHPLEYAGFEGKIPEGSYGAGTVMVWDRGTFNVIGAPEAARQIQGGEIKFHLNGEKLRGSFVLVKLKQSEKGNEWLLIKHKDADADPAWYVDEHDGSVLTGRTLEEIAEELPPTRSANPLRPAEVNGARKSAMPAKVGFMLATPIQRPFSDASWLFEIKWDGVRALARLEDGSVTLHSRTGAPVSKRYPELASLPAAIDARNAILDGEIVALDARGHSDFERLQQRMHVRAPSPELLSAVPATYYVFDLLYCDGYDLRGSPLIERKELLRRLLRPSERVRFSDHQLEHGKELFELAREKGLEGIIGKRTDSAYTEGRSAKWVKVKTSRTLDAVIGGWTEPRAPGLAFGALLLGLYREGKLQFIGHVGSGFDGAAQAAMAKEFRNHAAAACPFEKVPETNEKPHWVSPVLVARVRFSGWTQERRLRHPVFVGLRDDIRPEDCLWENEAEVPATRTVVRTPEITGKVLSTDQRVEAELFTGKAENVTVEIDGKRMRFSNLNKVYFPESGYTKRNLLAYYYRMAGHVLPFLRDRPLVLRRYPDGIRGQSFFQKDVREGIPGWLATVPLPSGEAGEKIHYAVANDRASLLFLTSLGCIDHNSWSSRISDLEHPDYFFFDLDPSEGTDFSVVVTIARALSEKLEELGLAVFLKTSGATGFHLYIPVEPNYTYAQLRAFAEVVARVAAAEHPNLVTNERSVARRPAGRVLIDVHQNALGRPLAAPYVVRAFPKAPVSAPVLARELRAELKPEKFNMNNMDARIERVGDLWENFWKNRQTIEEAIERLSASVAAAPDKR
jgi:bifunctional non-homologous end joining protein LigD